MERWVKTCMRVCGEVANTLIPWAAATLRPLLRHSDCSDSRPTHIVLMAMPRLLYTSLGLSACLAMSLRCALSRLRTLVRVRLRAARGTFIGVFFL